MYNNKISVAIATYNGALYIEKQLTSIINQTRRVDEIVVSDDGSSDNTLEIVREISKRPEAAGINFVLLTDNPRHGYCGNFEHAISCCTGDYIFITDQDDVWIDKKVERVIKVFEDNPGLLLVFHDGLLIDKDDNPISGTFNDYPCPEGKVSQDVFLEKAVSTPIWRGMVMCISKEFLGFLLPFPAITGFHDQWLAFCALCQDSIYYLDEQLTRYRLHSKSTSGGNKATKISIKDRITRIKKKTVHYSNLKENNDIYVLGSAMKNKLVENRINNTAAFEAAEQICEIGKIVIETYMSNRFVGCLKLNMLYITNPRYRKSGTAVHFYRLVGLLFRRKNA